jgi:hypothetical protein
MHLPKKKLAQMFIGATCKRLTHYWRLIFDTMLSWMPSWTPWGLQDAPKAEMRLDGGLAGFPH